MEYTTRQLENRAKILDEIYVNSPISRIDISNKTGITPATVSEMTGTLINEGIIFESSEAEPIHSKVGRKKILLSTLPEHSYYIGIELSERFISFGVTDNSGKIYEEEVFTINPDKKNKQLKEFITHDYVFDKLSKFLDQHEEYSPVALGIAIPGHYDEQNNKILSNNPLWINFDLEKLLSNINIPYYLDNNVHCMSIKERLFGDRRNDFVILHISRGIFCSYMFNGNLYKSTNYSIGEIGHMVVNTDGELCDCGRRGCLQTYASEKWLVKKAQVLFENTDDTYLKQIVSDKENIDINILLAAYKLGDKAIIDILHIAIKHIGVAINTIPMFFDTNNIYIHSILLQETPLINLLDKYIDYDVKLFDNQKDLEVSIKDYSPINGALGACSLAINNHLIQKI